MSMVTNAVGIIVKWRKGSCTEYVLEMGNENSLDLNKDSTIFDGVSDMDDLISRFNKGFSDPWDEGNDFFANIEYFDYDNEYKKFTARLRKKAVSDISFICLFTDDAFEFDERCFVWSKYWLEDDYGFYSGTETMKEPAFYSTADRGIGFVKELVGIA